MSVTLIYYHTEDGLRHARGPVRTHFHNIYCRFVAGVDETSQLQIVTRGDDALFPKGAPQPQAAYRVSQSPSMVKHSFQHLYILTYVYLVIQSHDKPEKAESYYGGVM